MTFVLPSRRGKPEAAPVPEPCTPAPLDPDPEAAWFRSAVEGEAVVVRIGGCWTTRDLGITGRALRGYRPPETKAIILDLSAVELLDTSGAWVIHKDPRAPFDGHDRGDPARGQHGGGGHAGDRGRA